MRIFDMFKKKKQDAPQNTLSCDGFPMEALNAPANPYLQAVKNPDGTTGTPTADAPKKTMQEVFAEWYKTLSPEKRKSVDKKIEKLTLRAGTPVRCTICKNPGSNKALGPFRKVEGGYAHENCLKEPKSE